MEKCPICRMPASLGAYNGGNFRFDCLRCGEFSITTEADEALKATPLGKMQVGAASGYVRENAGLEITFKDLPGLQNPRIPTVQQKAAKLLLALSREFPQPGTWIQDPVPRIIATVSVLAPHASSSVIPDEDVPDYAAFLKWLSLAAVYDAAELRWLMMEVLAEHGFLEFARRKEVFENQGYSFLLLTARGWAEIERMHRANSESSFGFVAMSFRNEFKTLYSEGIEPGIRAAGFEALRVDQKEHNNRIDDEIIASIRSSRFLVADFSVDRGGIYFEAGYALGLGLPVIWLVKDSEKDTIHFDNRQYNFIRWQPENWPALISALKNRIEATIGRGPLRSVKR